MNVKISPGVRVVIDVRVNHINFLYVTGLKHIEINMIIY